MHQRIGLSAAFGVQNTESFKLVANMPLQQLTLTITLTY